jgi:hypothetical protein
MLDSTAIFDRILIAGPRHRARRESHAPRFDSFVLRFEPRSSSVKPSATTFVRVIIVAALLIAFGGAVAGCGQRGPLYYPDKDNPDRRR